jgi:PAS domain S-box-containing protein
MNGSRSKVGGSILQKGKDAPFSHALLLAIILTVSLAVVGITYFSYLNVQRELEENARILQIQGEHLLITSFQIKDAGLRLYDDTMNTRMESAFEPFIAEYERSGRNPAQMDLEGLQATLGEEMEFYVINADAVIEYTTYLPDQGLDFKQFTSYFPTYLEQIRESGGFFPDRVVSEVTTGNLKKFAYTATPDHKYVLEIGLSAEIFQEERASFHMSDEEIIQEAKDRNPMFGQIRIFDTSLREKREAISYPVEDAALQGALATILSERHGTEQMDVASGNITHYLFIDLRDPRYGTDPSLILELTYTRANINQALQGVILSHFGIAVVAILLSSLLALLLSRHLTRPIDTMVEDVDAIAGGDLDHPVSHVSGYEFGVLERSLQLMVDRLKSHIRMCEVSEKRFMDLVQLLPQGIFETNLQGELAFANPAAFNSFLYAPPDLNRGLTIFDVLIPEDRDRANETLGVILQGKKTEGSEYTGLRKDGTTFPILVYTAPIIQEQTVTGVRGTIVDLTRLKKIEAEVRQLNVELERRVAQRTSELEDATREMEAFTYSVSHDLRAPLRAIDGFSSILMQSAREHLSERERHSLELIRNNTKHMDGLIEGLLILSRMGRQEMKREWVSPEPIVREILRELQEASPERTTDIEIGDLPPCYADPVMLRQVFVNLLSNAMKFTKTREQTKIEIGVLDEEARTVYFVRDNGIGFDMRYKDKLFKPFQRLHSSTEYEGTGVGLAIVHRILRRHEGSIWAESVLGSGTTFFFTFGGESTP